MNKSNGPDNHNGNTNGNGHATNGNGLHTPEQFGHDLATAAVEQMDNQAGHICHTERLRLEATNQPKIAAAKQDLAGVERELAKIAREESQLPPEGDLRKRRRVALLLFALGLGLCISGFASAIYALDPIMPGASKYVVALGLAVILPFSVHEAIDRWSHSERVMQWLVACNCALAFVAMVTLGLIRSRVFAEQMSQASAPAVVIDTDAPVVAAPPSTFYQRIGCLLTVFSMFSAVAMEIAAGLALHRASRLWAEMPAGAAELRGRRAELQQRKIELVEAIAAWEQEPQEFVNRFWRDYHDGQMRGIKRFTKMFMAVFFFLSLSAGMPRAHAQAPLNLVVALDLTASVGRATGLDHKTELQRDVATVGKLLASVPAGSRVTVIGITDRSFAEPYVLLSAHLDGNEGYFHERIKSAREQLVAAWQKRSEKFVENFPQTDLLGALVMASQVFEPSDGHRNVLVILSDMRHETRSLNLARLSVVPVKRMLDKVESAGLVPDLKGVEVYVLGVDAAGKSVAYWNSLREFWLAYFEKAGAKVRAYSMLRDLPQL